jgi:glucan phosphoethanolaminetransferase (alkaline phosphatase superfamily)
MKRLFGHTIIAATCIFILSNMISLLSFAQDSSSGSSTRTTTTQSVTTIQPWMWLVGGIVLLIIIIALVSGKNKNTVSNDKVTYTKTVERD